MMLGESINKNLSSLGWDGRGEGDGGGCISLISSGPSINGDAGVAMSL